ncbi:MAG: permease-like cell division protein FtsX [Bacteroidales bacterium]|nr:permease-like cell division protein FtsX [Bacteroidales bacterium]
MSKKNNISRRSITSAYILTTISLTLVLFMLGIVGWLILNSKKLSDTVKENIVLTVVLHDNISPEDLATLQDEIKSLKYIKTLRFISKEQAAAEFTKQVGEDFVSLLGYNPLLPSIEMTLHAQYANTPFIQLIESKLRQNPSVKEIIYEQSLIHLVNQNIRSISLIILVFSALLLLIAVSLINNNVRLLVYSKRFIIRTMQLVGATRGFIRKPFLYKSILQGFIAGFLANLLIIGLLYMANLELKEINLMISYNLLVYLFTGIIVVGIVINWICTFFALNRYLRISTDKLYIL